MPPQGCESCASFNGCVQVLRRLADQIVAADDADICASPGDDDAAYLHRTVRDTITIELAKGLLAERHQLDLPSAEVFLEELAQRVGLTPAAAARLLVAGHPLED